MIRFRYVIDARSECRSVAGWSRGFTGKGRFVEWRLDVVIFCLLLVIGY